MANNMKLDSSWDVIPGRGLTRIGGVEYVAQNTKSRIQTRLGECFDKSRGVPWNDSILGSTTITDQTIKDIISAAIMDTPDVVAITSMNVTRESRTANVSFVAVSAYGTFESGIYE